MVTTHMNRAGLLILVLAVGGGCTHRAVVVGDEAGPVDGAVDVVGRDWVNPAAPDHIYLVDELSVLLRFLPKSRQTFKVGQLNCPGANNYAHSMSVDRFGVAWVNLRPDALARVNTKTASCQPTSYKAPTGYELFGMGFAPAGPGSAVERLYISSSTFASGKPTGMLAWVDTTTLAVNVIGSFPTSDLSPELTGTRNGKLYGFFPGKTKTFVARLDQATGKALKIWPMPALGHQVSAWAFAHWGGMFYVFEAHTGNTRVLRLDPSTGKVVTWVKDLGYRVVGAGVSARAPGAANDLGI